MEKKTCERRSNARGCKKRRVGAGREAQGLPMVLVGAGEVVGKRRAWWQRGWLVAHLVVALYSVGMGCCICGLLK